MSVITMNCDSKYTRLLRELSSQKEINRFHVQYIKEQQEEMRRLIGLIDNEKAKGDK